MSEVVGKSLQFSISTQSRNDSFLFNRPNLTIGQQRDLDVHPDEFLRLRNGGPENDFEVDAVALLGTKAVQAITTT